MKKYIFLILVSLLLISDGSPIYANAPISDIAVSGRSAVLMEQESGRVLVAKQEHEERKIASITKIMTAILAIESGKLTEKVKVSYEATGVEGSSLYLKPKEKVTLEDLTYGLMLRSGNDAAVAIAEHVGGSVDGFVYMMNKKAQEIGMNDSQFTNPHGLDDGEEHYSTAYDMALLMQYAMKNEKFREISQTERYKSPQEGEKWDRVWNNKNKLLTSLYEYCTGGKTGYTKKAGRTLVTTAEKDGMSLIAVTLDAPSDWDDHIAMYEAGFARYSLVQMATAQEKLPVKGLQKGKLYTEEDVYYPVTENEKNSIQKKIIVNKDALDAKVPRTVAGKIEWYIDNELVQSAALIYEKPIEREDNFFKKLFRFFS
ncbi:D-alanyl-D-alanine carboxypeptidase family protein [Bacillus piscicola]|uniref:D-alanyl-D-alanine carboxypeptidase family protein n=1 Tax=Bacillus piscicola TaxID=1632684 RepID=UPI0023DDCD2C|nr:D-alanyl-D-alanine carboxypeptidase family protein [Bacillus piscicola]